MKLSEKDLEVITQAVISVLDKEKVRKKELDQDWRLRNTRILLKNYRMLRDHCQRENEDIDEALEELKDEYAEFGNILFRPEELTLKSAMKYRIKTQKMLNYFEVMFEVYERYCKAESELAKRRFEIVNKLYVSDQRIGVTQAMELYKIEQRTVYKDISKAEQELSVFLFGVDSLDDLNAKSVQH